MKKIIKNMVYIIIFFVVILIPIAFIWFTDTTEPISNRNLSIKKELVTQSGEKIISGKLKLRIEKNKLYHLDIVTDNYDKYSNDDKDSWEYYFYVDDKGKVISKKSSDNIKPIKQKRNDKIKRDVLVPVFYLYDKNKKPESIQLCQDIDTILLQSLGRKGEMLAYGLFLGIWIILVVVILCSSFKYACEDD